MQVVIRGEEKPRIEDFQPVDVAFRPHTVCIEGEAHLARVPSKRGAPGRLIRRFDRIGRAQRRVEPVRSEEGLSLPHCESGPVVRVRKQVVPVADDIGRDQTRKSLHVGKRRALVVQEPGVPRFPRRDRRQLDLLLFHRDAVAKAVRRECRRSRVGWLNGHPLPLGSVVRQPVVIGFRVVVDSMPQGLYDRVVGPAPHGPPVEEHVVARIEFSVGFPFYVDRVLDQVHRPRGADVLRKLSSTVSVNLDRAGIKPCHAHSSCSEKRWIQLVNTRIVDGDPEPLAALQNT